MTEDQINRLCERLQKAIIAEANAVVRAKQAREVARNAEQAVRAAVEERIEAFDDYEKALGD